MVRRPALDLAQVSREGVTPDGHVERIPKGAVDVVRRPSREALLLLHLGIELLAVLRRELVQAVSAGAGDGADSRVCPGAYLTWESSRRNVRADSSRLNVHPARQAWPGAGGGRP